MSRASPRRQKAISPQIYYLRCNFPRKVITWVSTLNYPGIEGLNFHKNQITHKGYKNRQGKVVLRSYPDTKLAQTQVYHRASDKGARGRHETTNRGLKPTKLGHTAHRKFLRASLFFFTGTWGPLNRRLTFGQGPYTLAHFKDLVGTRNFQVSLLGDKALNCAAPVHNLGTRTHRVPLGRP